MTRVLSLLANPTAGRGRAATQVDRVHATLSNAVPDAEVRLVAARGFAAAATAATQIVAEARPGVDELIVMGGDGMAGLGVDVAAGSGVGLGIIPAGTGNDICRGIGLPLDPIAAARSIARLPLRPVDVIAARGTLTGGRQLRHVGSIVATGFDARVNRRANHINLPIGSLRYLASVAAEVATFGPRNYRLTIDGRVRELPAILVAVANTRYFGGGIPIAPAARADDGLLDITIIHPVSRMTLFRLLPALRAGSFFGHPAVEHFRVASLGVDGEGIFTMGDGEELGAAPIELAVQPGGVLVHAPADSA